MESKDDIFDPLKEKIRNGKGHLRKMGSDFLAYSKKKIRHDEYEISS